MRNTPYIFLFLSCVLSAELPSISYDDPHKIGVQNSILAKVNGTTISMMDVKKKMDFVFYQNFPNLAESNQARLQFYETSWRRMLMEIIDNELILADAADREIKLADAEVREEMETRFGPNVMTMLDKIGLSYDEAWKMIKNDMIVQRMSWWFIQAKAMAKVTPQEIRQSYRLYLKDHPAFTEWKYRVLTLRGEQSREASIALYQEILAQNPSRDNFPDFLKKFEAEHPGCQVAISAEYTASDSELAESHRSALASLTPGSFGAPIQQISRDQQKLYRIFHLSERIEHPAPSFDEMATNLKNELLQKKSMEISQAYIEKLRKFYRFDQTHLNESLPSDLKPFSIQ